MNNNNQTNQQQITTHTFFKKKKTQQTPNKENLIKNKKIAITKNRTYTNQQKTRKPPTTKNN